MKSVNTAVRARRDVMFRRVALVTLCAFALGGCSTMRGWFSSDKDDGKPNEPMELTKIVPSVTVSKLWSAKAGDGEGRLGANQGPVVADGRVYAAAVEGGVRAFDLQSGKSLWHFESDLRLAGGPGAGDGLVVVGSLNGDVIALDAASGTEKWRAKVSNEVIAAPVVGQSMVVVRSNDGRVTALDAATGARRWFWSREVPLLSVRGNDAPTLGPGVVFVGNDDGTVAALAANDGRLLWDEVVGEADGRTELDRMADVDGSPVLDDTTVYATSFKRRTIALDGPSGRPVWASDHGGAGRIGVAPNRVVVTDPAGTVYALDKLAGGALWQQPGLARRRVTGPAVHGDFAVVGDFDGYLHWLKLDNGEFAARARAGGDAVRATPVVADGVLIVQSIGGELSAFRLN